MIRGVTVLDNALDRLDIRAHPVRSRLVTVELEDVASCVQYAGVEDIIESAFTLLDEKVRDDVWGIAETPIEEIG